MVVPQGDWVQAQGDCLAAKTAGSPIINDAAQGGFDRYHEISNKRAPGVVTLIVEHPDIDLSQTALNLFKLEIDIEAFEIKNRPKGISKKKRVNGGEKMKDLEGIIKEENYTLKEEYKNSEKLKTRLQKFGKLGEVYWAQSIKHQSRLVLAILQPGNW